MSASDRLTTSVEHREGVVLVAVGCEIDAISAPILDRAISEALADKPPALVLDFSRVQFLAAAGLRVLSKTQDAVGKSANSALVSSSGIISKTIRLVGLDATFSLCKTVDDALSSVSTNMESRG
jgi:anti-sigma B factor antagonist